MQGPFSKPSLKLEHSVWLATFIILPKKTKEKKTSMPRRKLSLAKINSCSWKKERKMRLSQILFMKKKEKENQFVIKVGKGWGDNYLLQASHKVWEQRHTK